MKNERELWGGASILVLMAAFGLTTGLLHAALYMFRHFALGRFTWMPRDTLWMAPLAYTAYFVAAGLVLVSVRWRWRAISGRWLLFVPCTLLAAMLLLLSNRIHPLAQIVLAIGVGSFLSGVLGKHERALRHGLGLWFFTAIVLVGLSGAGEHAWRAFRERAALRSAHPADSSHPNIVLLILDTVRAQDMSLYGYARPTTPVLDSLASSAVVFDAAFSPSSWTLPSHASMFTGRRPFALNTGWNTPLDDRDPTLAERFADAGYATGGFVANLLYTTYESGLSRGFQHYDDHRISAKQVLLTSSPFRNRRTHDLLTARSMAGFRRAIDVLGNMRVRPNISSDRKRAPEVVAEFLDWQSTRDRPFLAFLNLFDAHEPYDAPGPWRTDPASGPTPRDFYDGSIARLDAQIGVLLDSLHRRGVLDHTIVVITSDHGEQFGEHGLRSHGNSLYIQTIHVPLVMLLPDGAGAGRRVRTPVSLTDIGATLLRLSHLDQGGFPGRSMQWPDSTDGETAGAPVIVEVRGTGDRVRRDPTFFGPMISVIRGPWHLIRRGDGLEELFDIHADPDEIVDLVSSPAHAGTRDSLAAILDRVR